MYIQRNIKERSCNHCCCLIVISITYSESLFVVYGIQHAMRMPHVVTCDLPIVS